MLLATDSYNNKITFISTNNSLRATNRELYGAAPGGCH